MSAGPKAAPLARPLPLSKLPRAGGARVCAFLPSLKVHSTVVRAVGPVGGAGPVLPRPASTTAQIARSGLALLAQSRTERRVSRQSNRAQNRRSVGRRLRAHMCRYGASRGVQPATFGARVRCAEADRQIWRDHAPAVRPFNRSDRWLRSPSRAIAIDVLRAGLLVGTIDRSLMCVLPCHAAHVRW
jgi:hypothetical protein